VSRGTPMISPILKWNHDDDHFVPYFDSFSNYSTRNLVLNLNDKNLEFMKGHVIGNRVLFPAAGWIFHVWETYAMMLGESYVKLNVVIDDIKFLRATKLIENQDNHVTIAIHRGNRFIFIDGITVTKMLLSLQVLEGSKYLKVNQSYAKGRSKLWMKF
jgi:fatty acid synthase, animal type